MTAGTTIGVPPQIPSPASYGAIIGDTSGTAPIHHLVGGTGTAQWKTLINGMHLAGGWKIIEFVRLAPGASCGAHLHAGCEEFYYILDGEALMTINHQDVPVSAGDLVTAPLGTTHGISVPTAAGAAMSFFVVEAFPGGDPPRRAPERISLPPGLHQCAGFRGGGHDQQTRISMVDLTEHLTGSLLRVTLIEIPPRAEEAPLAYQLPGHVNEVLFVVSGDAEITAGDLQAKGGPGLCVGTPAGAAMMIGNLRGEQPLTVLSTEAAA
jgi:mannose-6-phosphate isomerase-like protein (cupin superfamily)